MKTTNKKEDKDSKKGNAGIDATTQAQTPLEKFEKDKDHLMREVERDLDVLAWICWGLELYFEDLSYEDMRKYMEHPDYKDIEKHIITVPPRVRARGNPGVELDLMCIIKQTIKGELDIKGLDIENQIAYSEDTIGNRTEIYQSAGQFSLEREYPSNRYKKIPTIVTLWVFPKPKSKARKNHMHVFQDTGIMKDIDGEDISSKNEENSKERHKQTYYFFLGNPLKVDVDSDKVDKDESELKKRYLLLLLDCLFNYEASVEKKLEILEQYFNIKGNEVQKEVEAMTQLMREYDDYTGGIISKNERLEEENGELKEKYGTLEEKYGTLEERNMTLEAQKQEYMNKYIEQLKQNGYSEEEAKAEAERFFN